MAWHLFRLLGLVTWCLEINLLLLSRCSMFSSALLLGIPQLPLSKWYDKNIYKKLFDLIFIKLYLQLCPFLSCTKVPLVIHCSSWNNLMRWIHPKRKFKKKLLISKHLARWLIWMYYACEICRHSILLNLQMWHWKSLARQSMEKFLKNLLVFWLNHCPWRRSLKLDLELVIINLQVQLAKPWKSRQQHHLWLWNWWEASDSILWVILKVKSFKMFNLNNLGWVWDTCFQEIKLQRM